MPKRCWSHFSGWSVPEMPRGGTPPQCKTRQGQSWVQNKAWAVSVLREVAVVQADYCHAECWFDRGSLAWYLELECEVVSWLLILSTLERVCDPSGFFKSPVKMSESVHSFNLLLNEVSPCLMLKISFQNQGELNWVGSASVSLLGPRHFFSPFLTGEKTQQNSHLSASPPSVCLTLSLWCLYVWRPEVDVTCLPQCLFTLNTQAGTLTWTQSLPPHPFLF